MYLTFYLARPLPEHCWLYTPPPHQKHVMAQGAGASSLGEEKRLLGSGQAGGSLNAGSSSWAMWSILPLSQQCTLPEHRLGRCTPLCITGHRQDIYKARSPVQHSTAC